MKGRLTVKIICLALVVLRFPVCAQARPAIYSLMLRAAAPNAGGQEAYGLKAGNDDFEASLFVNTFLQTGSVPLMGATGAWRFPICGRDCWFWQFYVSMGLGVASAGPMFELTWTMMPLSIVRIDFGTQFFATRRRVIMWSYPLWIGVSVPFALPFFF